MIYLEPFYNMFDEFLIFAKPSLIKVTPNHFTLALSTFQNFEIYINSKFLSKITNVYLSASNTNMFNNISTYDLFSSLSSEISDLNPPFNAIEVLNFSYTEKLLSFTFPQIPNDIGVIDVIALNEAGYGKLSTNVPLGIAII